MRSEVLGARPRLTLAVAVVLAATRGSAAAAPPAVGGGPGRSPTPAGASPAAPHESEPDGPPAACAEAAPLFEVLQSFLTQDIDWVERGVGRLEQLIGSDCRRAIEDGAWPGFGRLLVDIGTSRPNTRDRVCSMAPRELSAAIAKWQAVGRRPRRGSADHRAVRALATP